MQRNVRDSERGMDPAVREREVCLLYPGVRMP